MKTRLSVPAGVAAAALAAAFGSSFGLALTADGNDPWTALCEKYDADGDGVITRAEYTRDEAHWKNLDVDGSGALDRKEFEGRKWNRGDAKRPEPPKVGQLAPDFELELLPEPQKLLPGEPASSAGRATPAGPISKGGKAEPDAKPKEPVRVRLSSFRGKRPVALIFGSYT